MPASLETSRLDTFLVSPDIGESPAWEFINEQAYQKPMPTLFHSRLQRNLVNQINRQNSPYEAIQELRCVVPPFSPVLDVSVIAIARLPDTDGPFQGAPDWLIEIRSPDQSTVKLQEKILHCIGHGTQLAWLIDLQRQQIWVWQGQELPLIYANDEKLPILDGLSSLTANEVLALATQR